MMIRALLLSVLLLGCEPYPIEVSADAGPDSGCAVWGVDGKGGRYCMSTTPDPCPGPWGCAKVDSP